MFIIGLLLLGVSIFILFLGRNDSEYGVHEGRTFFLITAAIGISLILHGPFHWLVSLLIQ
jgi:hypothetical protein